MTMLEKMARAMWEAASQAMETDSGLGNWDDLDDWERETEIAAARAALGALREPDEGMCEAGIDTGAVANDQYHIKPDHIAIVWKAMIDHILSEESE